MQRKQEASPNYGFREEREKIMAVIKPVSDLRNYNTVLEDVAEGSPVYLTVNGRGRYTIRDIADDEEFEKTKAMLKLMCELAEGRKSGEEEGYISSDEVRAHFMEKRHEI
jgi:hypothetical protein